MEIDAMFGFYAPKESDIGLERLVSAIVYVQFLNQFRKIQNISSYNLKPLQGLSVFSTTFPSIPNSKRLWDFRIF